MIFSCKNPQMRRKIIKTIKRSFFLPWI